MPETQAIQAPANGQFTKDDPRIWKHGASPAATFEIRRLMLTDVPAARARLLLLIESKDEGIAIQAVALAYAYGVGKPRTAPEDLEAILRSQLSDVTERLRAKLKPELFAEFVEAAKR
jgi:hypothetical protein